MTEFASTPLPSSASDEELGRHHPELNHCAIERILDILQAWTELFKTQPPDLNLRLAGGRYDHHRSLVVEQSNVMFPMLGNGDQPYLVYNVRPDSHRMEITATLLAIPDPRTSGWKRSKATPSHQ